MIAGEIRPNKVLDLMPEIGENTPLNFQDVSGSTTQKDYTMKNSRILATVVAGAIGLLFAGTGYAADGDVSVLIDKTIEITKADVDAMADAMFKAYEASIPSNQVAEAKQSIRQSVLKQLTIQALLKRECDKESIAVTDEERDAFFTKMTGGKESVTNVAAQSNMSVEKFQALLSTNLRIEKLLESKIAKLPEPTEEDAKKKFTEIIESNPEAVKVPESVEAAHILVKVDETTKDEDAKKKIEDIRAKLVAGGDFAELAKTSSDCPSKDNGGNLGSFGRGQMVKEFEDAAFTQEIGAIGDVVKSQFGYHVVKVIAKKPASEVKFDDVKSEIMLSLKQQGAKNVRNEFILGVEKAAQIENLEAPVVSEPVEAPARQLPAWAE